MSMPAERAAWWPMAVAALLLVLGSSWLGHSLHSGPPRPMPAPTVTPNAASSDFTLPATSEPTAPDTARAMMATTEAKQRHHVPCKPRPTQFVSNPALRRPLVVRRYVGTVGGQAATAELKWYTPDSTTLRFYLHSGGSEYITQSYRQRPGRVVVPVYPDYRLDSLDHGSLAVNGRAGTVLQGYWSKNNHTTAFRLRENYAGSVRYSLRRVVLLSGMDNDSYPAEYSCVNLRYEHDFLTLLRPVAATPQLRTLLHTTPAARHRQVLDTRDSYSDEWKSIHVRLNEFGLFSYQTFLEAMPYGGRRQDDVTSTLVDLRTGHVLSIASQLRPGYELTLRQLLTHHLLHDYSFDHVNSVNSSTGDVDWDWEDSTLVQLPDLQESGADDLMLTPAGLEATYSPVNLLNNWIGPPEIVLIPYHELLPLVRPGTPLARMLRARRITAAPSMQKQLPATRPKAVLRQNH